MITDLDMSPSLGSVYHLCLSFFLYATQFWNTAMSCVQFFYNGDYNAIRLNQTIHSNWVSVNLNSQMVSNTKIDNLQVEFVRSEQDKRVWTNK